VGFINVVEIKDIRYTMEALLRLCKDIQVAKKIIRIIMVCRRSHFCRKLFL